MKSIEKMTNAELLEEYSKGNEAIVRECFERFMYYVERNEIPEHDTAYDTYKH